MFPVLRKRFYSGSRLRNLLKNSVSDGIVAGTPGTLPRGWGGFFPDVSSGITTQVIGPVNDSGLDCFDWRISGTPGVGTIAFRSVASIAFGTRTNTTVNKPAGTVAGDILVATFWFGNSSLSAATVTPPAGWTLIGGASSSVSHPDPYDLACYCYKYVAGGSEPASYTFTHASFESEGAICAFSGGDQNNPILAASVTVANTQTPTASSITTTRNNAGVVFFAACWDSATTSAAPTGTTPTFTTRFSGAASYVASGVMATAGATGAKSITCPSQNGANPTITAMIEVQPAPTALGFTGLFLTGNFDIPAVNGDFLTESMYLKIVAGSLPALGINLQMNEVDASNTFLTNHNTVITPTATFTRFSGTTQNTQATCSFVQPSLTINYNAALDLTLRIGGAQTERGVVTSPFERRLAV